MPTTTPAPRTSRAEPALIAAALVAGTFARVAWMADKPFWRDEAWVALTAREPLADALARSVPVPVGFLALTRLAGVLPLAPEVALRLLPLFAGAAAMLAIPALARALGASRRVCVASAWIGAGLPAFIYYSRELKPYALDLLLGALVPLLAVHSFATPPAPRRPATWGLFATLAAAPWISFGGVLVVVGTLAAFAARAWRTREDRAGLIAAAAVAWVSIGISYAVALRGQTARAVRHLDYLTGDGSTVAGVTTLVPYLFRSAWPAAAGLVLIGLAAVFARRRALTIRLALAITAATLAASTAGLYTLSQPRLLLFLAPWLVLFCATGMEALAAVFARRLAANAVMALGVLASLLGMTASVRHRRAPYQDERRSYFVYDILHDVEPLIGVIAERATPADEVYASRYAGDPFRYYARGRLRWALVCGDSNCRDERPAFESWLGGVGTRAFVVLLTEEDRPWRRDLLERAGLEPHVLATGRGTLLWELRRRQDGRTGPRTTVSI